MVRFILSGVLSAALAAGAPQAQSQEAAPGVHGQQEDQYFSGTITALDAAKITVTRTVLGTEPTTKTFLITAETRYEGKPKVKARVTVRFVPGDEGERAVQVVVRPNSTKK